MRLPRATVASPLARSHFAPKVSIVTGGAAGIGRSIAAELVRRGGLVVLADLDEAAASQTAEQLTAMGPGRAEARALDVRDGAAIRTLVQVVAADNGRLDLMVNNAGVLFNGQFEDMDERHWDTAIDVNIRGVVHGCRAAYEVMLKQGWGDILNTGSLAGLMPAPLSTPYTMSKWAVVGLSQALRVESLGKGINVSVLCPGYVDTKLLDEPFEPTKGFEPGAFRAHTKHLQPRLITPDEVAATAIAGLEARRAVIPVGWFAGAMSRLHRFAPKVLEVGSRVDTRREQKRAARSR